MPAHITLISGSCRSICGPVHFMCAFQFCAAQQRGSPWRQAPWLTLSFPYWLGLTTASDSCAMRCAALMPPRSSRGSGWDGPPKSVLRTMRNCPSQARRPTARAAGAYMLMPNSRMSRILAGLVLLLKKALTSSSP